MHAGMQVFILHGKYKKLVVAIKLELGCLLDSEKATVRLVA